MGFLGRSEKEKEVPDQTQGESTLPKASRYFLIEKHSTWSKNIKTYDVTGYIDKPYMAEGWDELMESIQEKVPGKSKNGTEVQPTLAISRSTYFTLTLIVTEPPESTAIATWKAGAFSSQKCAVKFPADSPHSSHDIEIKPISTFGSGDEFVKDSCRYTGKFDRLMSSRFFTLSKHIGGQEIPVAHYRMAKMSFRIGGGILAVDEQEIDPVVAVMWCVNTLRKVEQRSGERSS